ncbi:hypothetical protein EQ500_06740, partial [Lactobacillus sp. XV13L]|nr:hypothetical protein [Lactobacillus sp. XV13L]
MKVKVLLAIKAKPFFRHTAAWWLGCWILVIAVAWLLAPQLKRGRTPTYLDVYGVILLYSVLTIIGPEKSSFKLSLQYGISRRNYTLMMILFQLVNALF